MRFLSRPAGAEFACFIHRTIHILWTTLPPNRLSCVKMHFNPFFARGIAATEDDIVPKLRHLGRRRLKKYRGRYKIMPLFGS
jgi:hypothetical protein